MSDSPWSNNPFAPKIPYDVYFGEKTSLAGAIVGGMFYGTSTYMPPSLPLLTLFAVLGGLVVLFFQCMAALFSPINRRRQGGVKRGLVIYTVAMFSFATVYTGLNTDIQSVSLIDNREFPGIGDTIPPGPLGYQMYIYSKPITIIPNLMFLLNNWMADGLLVGFSSSSPDKVFDADDSSSSIVVTLSTLRTHGSSPSHASRTSPLWVRIRFLHKPATLWTNVFTTAMGTTFIYQTSQPNSSVWNTVAIDFGLPYFSISVGLNILLTLMIATYLTLHGRNVCLARGAPSGTTGLYKTVITMLVESSALYAVSSLLFIGTWGARSHAADIFLSILGEVQVRGFLYSWPATVSEIFCLI